MDSSLNSTPSPLAQEDQFLCAPLVVARRTSQVCMEWRNVILRCPNLWGGILDIQHLSQRNSHWRSLVIQRTGTSLLSIRGKILNSGDFSPELQSFFLLLLKENWTRILSLDVVLGLGPGFTLDNAVVSLFSGPAPNLETFRIFFVDKIVPQTFFLPRFCFTNDCPRLRHLSVTGLRYQTLAPWFTHLRSLTLTCPFTVFEILHALTLAQNLEYLDLGNLAAVGGPVSPVPYLPHANVPRLREILINNTFITCFLFLKNISSATGCSLSMFGSHINDVIELPHVDKVTVAKLLAYHSQSYLYTHPATSYHAHVGYDQCAFAQFPSVIQSPPSFFSIRVAEEGILNEDALFVFLHAYSIRIMPKITKLQLGITLSAVHITDHIRSDMLQFLHSLPGVQELAVQGRDTLQYLLALAACEARDPRHPSIAFPLLTKLSMEHFDRNCLGMVVAFLAWRRDLGVPIQTLHITTLMDNDLRDFSLIDIMRGLEVVWTIWDAGHAREYTYICGSGDSRQLHLDYYVV